MDIAEPESVLFGKFFVPFIRKPLKHRLSKSSYKQSVAVFPLRAEHFTVHVLLCLEFFQHGKHYIWKFQRANRAFGFGSVCKITVCGCVIRCSSHAYNVILPVHVFPLKPHKFTISESAVHCQSKKSPVIECSFGICQFEKLFHFIDCVDLLFFFCAFGNKYFSAWI